MPIIEQQATTTYTCDCCGHTDTSMAEAAGGVDVQASQIEGGETIKVVPLPYRWLCAACWEAVHALLISRAP